MRYSIRIVLCYDNGGSQRDRDQIFVFHHNATTLSVCTASPLPRVLPLYLLIPPPFAFNVSVVHIYHNYCLYTFTLTCSCLRYYNRHCHRTATPPNYLRMHLYTVRLYY